MSEDELGWIAKLAESGKRVRLAPGVIGKSSAVFLGLILLWVVVIVRLSPTAPWWYNVMLVSGALIVTLLAVRETGKNRAFAEANPSLALMEGADITEYKRFEAQAKGLLAGDKSPPAIVVGPPSQTTDVVKPEGSQP